MGTSLLELMVTAGVMTILAGAVLPIASNSMRREREIQLRRALREVRVALDTYHRVCMSSFSATTGRPTRGQQQPRAVIMKIIDDPGSPPTCYPKSLDVLVEGVEVGNIPGDFKIRFLRRIPRDPFNIDDDENDEHGWTLRSSTDRPQGNLSWNRRNVFDIQSAVEWRALDGSYYKDW